VNAADGNNRCLFIRNTKMRFVKKKNIEVLVTAGGTRSYQPAWKLDVFSDRAS